jgi:hypothetical protein
MKIATAALAVALAIPITANGAERQVGSWTVHELTDPITNQPLVVAVIENKSDGTLFRVSCLRGKPIVAIWTRNHQYV